LIFQSFEPRISTLLREQETLHQITQLIVF
jgi:hypothetical protein